MSGLRVGYLSLVKGSWINDQLAGQRESALRALRELDIEIVDCGLLIQSEAEAEEVHRKFEEARVDVLLAHFITFSLGSIVPGLAVRLRKPVIFWAEPEPQMNGGRIAANSFCATNMNAHALWRMGLQYTLVYGAPDTACPELARTLRVFSCLKTLQRTRIGSLGGRVPGFYTSNFDELSLRARFGVEVEGVTLLELVRVAESVAGDELDAACRRLVGGCVCGISDDEMRKGAALLVAFERLARKYRLDAWAVRCWPEFSDLYGIGVCHVLACLTDADLPAACEGDVYGAVAMLALRELSGCAPFFCDLISFDAQGDTGLFWHCGAAPLSLCKPGCTPELRKHSIIDGGEKKGIANEFPLRGGPVTVMRISQTQDGGAYRILAIGAEGLETEQLLHGTPLRVRFRRPARELAQALVESGFEHHYVLCHGDIREELRLLAKMLGAELTEL